jgi:hypothetical protein
VETSLGELIRRGSRCWHETNLAGIQRLLPRGTTDMAVVEVTSELDPISEVEGASQQLRQCVAIFAVEKMSGVECPPTSPERFVAL